MHMELRLSWVSWVMGIHESDMSMVDNYINTFSHRYSHGYTGSVVSFQGWNICWEKKICKTTDDVKPKIKKSWSLCL